MITGNVKIKYSHVGVCVSDLQKSMKFYSEGLGFTEGPIIRDENGINALIGIPENLSLTCQFMTLDALTIELINFQNPALIAATTPRPMNQTGLTHLSFLVKDVDAVAASLEKLGGRKLQSTRITDRRDGITGEIVFCLDPDGTRIELMAYPDDVSFA